MPAPKFRGDYEQLGKIASSFGTQASNSQRMLQQVKGRMATLQGGDWIGQGARAFYKEMEQEVLPSLQRLAKAIERAQHVTLQISCILKEAEETAARLLGGAGAGAGAGVGGQAGAEAGAGAGSGAGGADNLAPLTAEQLRQAMPGLSQERADQLVPLLNNAMNEFNINTPERRNMFLAQIGHETGDLGRLTENLNYSREGLMATFPRHFNEETAADYARQPERIANHVYADRMGNGDEASGDGWRYRGRGAIQITGRDNYEAAGAALGLDLVNHPELLEQPENAARASAWWWQNHGLNERVDANPNDVEAVTRVINGGTTGLQDRQNRFDRINRVPVN